MRFKELGYTESVVTNAVVYLVIDNLLYVPSDSFTLYNISKKSDNGYEYIAFRRFGGYRKCRHERSCSSARRVSNGNIPQGCIYPRIKLYCNALGIDNVMSPLSHRGRTDTHTDTQTDSINTIVSQPIRGSTNNGGDMWN